MQLKLDSDRIINLLSFVGDKTAFIRSLLTAIELSASDNDASHIDICLDGWEEVAELNSIPGFAEKVWNRYNALVNAGLIDDRKQQ